MSKLGYTWYPKDWGNSENVFELNLTERGLYRELIDLAMLNDNKTEFKLEVWSRKFAVTTKELQSLLDRLTNLGLIQFKSKTLYIPSCESRLVLVRAGSKGGKISKPTTKPFSKPISKPISKQIESKVNIKESKINNEIFAFETALNTQWCEQLFIKHKVHPDSIQEIIKEFCGHLILKGDQKENVDDFKEHLANWLRVTDLARWKINYPQDIGKTNQRQPKYDD